MIKTRIDQDLKKAMLLGDKPVVSVLRGLKSSLLYEEVATGKRQDGLSEQHAIKVLRSEAKKRQETAELYKKAGEQERADQELSEKAVIDVYLPKQMSEADIQKMIEAAAADLGPISKQNMGQIIGYVKTKSAGAADGGTIAKLVQQRVSN